jgi:ribonuclease P protein component
MFVQSLGRESGIWRVERNKLKSDPPSRSFSFLLRWTAEGATPGVAGLGLVVSRRVGKAVVRQKIKRRLRHSFRLACQQVLGSVNCVLVVQGDACLRVAFQDLLAYFRAFLGRCGLVKDLSGAFTHGKGGPQ